MMPRSGLPLLLALLLPACTDPTQAPDPCGGRACEVAGVDLVLDSARILNDGGVTALAPGDTLRIGWSVLNRGDRASQATTLVVETQLRPAEMGNTSASVPALEPGEHVSGTAEVVLPPPDFVRSTRSDLAYPVYVSLDDPDGDPSFDNDRAELQGFTYAVPNLSSEIRALDVPHDTAGRPILAFGDEVRWEITVENVGLAALPDTALLVCMFLFPGDIGCESPQVPFSTLPSLAPGETLTDTVTSVFSAAMLDDYDAWNSLSSGRRGIYLCVPDDAEWGPPLGLCMTGTYVVVDPAAFVTLCDIGALAPAAAVGDADVADCIPAQSARDVWGLAAEAGVTYAIEGVGAWLEVRTTSGESLASGNDSVEFSADANGTYYILVSGEDYSLSVTAS